jgi:hypothetical protein
VRRLMCLSHPGVQAVWKICNKIWVNSAKSEPGTLPAISENGEIARDPHAADDE